LGKEGHPETSGYVFLIRAKGVGEEVRGRLSGRREERSDVAIP